MVKVTVISPLCSVTKEWNVNITLNEMCKKLQALTGVSPSDMKLTFEFEDGKPLKVVEHPSLDPDLCPLKSISHGTRIVVQDTNQNSMANQLQSSGGGDPSFKLSEETYAQRKDSILNWKIQNRWGRFDPETKARQENDRKLQQQRVNQLEVGERCSVCTNSQPERRGYLRYIGKISDINNLDIWCGIEFDCAVGKNDGTLNGKVYFGPVEANHGGFVKPCNVETGAQFVPLKEENESDEEL
ncbi:related to Tubulin-specific chaperone B [Zygosaccharomyces bailii]|nr:related to Tubulin-specific chaperone B [Zygosaccharomyces bailii]